MHIYSRDPYLEDPQGVFVTMTMCWTDTHNWVQSTGSGFRRMTRGHVINTGSRRADAHISAYLYRKHAVTEENTSQVKSIVMAVVSARY